MKKDFLLNFLLLFLVNLLVKPAWIFADLLVQRETGAEYGTYFVLMNVTMLLNIFLDLGISNFNNRKVAANTSRFTSYFSRFFTLRIVLSILYLMGLFVTAGAMSLGEEQRYLLMILGFNQVLISFITYFRSNLTALGFFKFDSLISILDRCIMILIILFVLFGSDELMSISLFVHVQFIGYLTGATIAFLILLTKEGLFKLKWKWKFNKTLLQKSFPYALIVILMSAYSYSDSLMLKEMRLDGIKQNAIYAQSFRIIMAVNNYTFLISVLLLPLFSRLLKQKKDINTLLRLSGTLLLYGTACMALIFHLFAGEFVHLLYGKFPGDFSMMERFGTGMSSLLNGSEVDYSAEVFSVLLLVCLPMSFNYIYGVLITASGEMKALNTLAAVTVLANLLMNYWLIPKQGALGAAIASLVTQSLFALAQCVYAYWRFKLPFSLNHLMKFIAVLALIFGLHELLRPYMTPIPLIAFLATLAGFGILVFRIVTPGNIKRYLLGQ